MRMYQLNERLKELRRVYGISQNALAKEMALTRATINAWEMGISFPNAHSLIMLSKYFKVSVDYLLGISDNEMLDISSLSDKEKGMIYDMVKHLADLKKSE